MRKRLIVLLLAVFILASGAFAKGNAWQPGDDPLMAPGDLALTAGIGYGFFWGALDVSGGAELMMGQFTIADAIPLTWGVAAKAAYYGFSDWHYLGAGGFGTLHLSIKDLNLPENLGWARNIDSYIGVGAGFYSYTWASGSYNEFRIGLRTVGGFNYFLNDRIAINFEGGYYGGWGSGLIGVLFKL